MNVVDACGGRMDEDVDLKLEPEGSMVELDFLLSTSLSAELLKARFLGFSVCLPIENEKACGDGKRGLAGA